MRLDRHRSEVSGGARFESARQVFRILDPVSRREAITAKALAREFGVGLSTCDYLTNILIDEGCLEGISPRQGHRLGPAVSVLHKRCTGDDLDLTVAPVINELAERSQRRAYLGAFSDGAVKVSRVASLPKSPPMGIVRGFHGTSLALALGKVLIAHVGVVDEYVDNFGLEASTPKTIVRPDLFRLRIERIRKPGICDGSRGVRREPLLRRRSDPWQERRGRWPTPLRFGASPTTRARWSIWSGELHNDASTLMLKEGAGDRSLPQDQE